MMLGFCSEGFRLFKLVFFFLNQSRDRKGFDFWVLCCSLYFYLTLG